MPAPYTLTPDDVYTVMDALARAIDAVLDIDDPRHYERADLDAIDSQAATFTDLYNRLCDAYGLPRVDPRPVDRTDHDEAD